MQTEWHSYEYIKIARFHFDYLKVNKEKCIGCGSCISICEEVFDFDDDNLAKVIENPVKEEHESSATDAMENCPTAAIEEE